MIPYIQRKSLNYQRIQQLLDISSSKNHFTNNGPVKNLLELKLAEMMELPKGKRVLCVSNGTTALHVIIYFYEQYMGRKLSWTSPSFTFPSCITNNTNIQIVDIDPKTYTMSEGAETDGVIITNLFGSKCIFDESLIPDKIVISDNASSFMSSFNGKNINLYGNIAFSSLHHTKTLGFGEGGFIVLDADIYDEVQSLCGFGFKSDRVSKPNSSNFKMSDVTAAFILQHIESYDISRHLEIQKHIKSNLDSMTHCKLFGWHHGIFYGNLPVVFNEPIETTPFRDAAIEANKYYKPLKSLPESNSLYSRIINFPLYCDLMDHEIDYIIKVIDSV